MSNNLEQKLTEEEKELLNNIVDLLVFSILLEIELKELGIKNE